MIIAIANLTVKTGTEQVFINAATECIAETVKEDGNIKYEVHQSINNRCMFTFVEEWKSIQDLNLHVKTDHFRTLNRVIKEIAEIPLAADIYEGKKL